MNGRDINEMKLTEIAKLIDKFASENKNWIPVKIAFLRNITMDTVMSPLKLLCYTDGIETNVHMCDYDNVMQNVLDIKSKLYQYNPDIIVVVLKLEQLSESLVSGFSALSSEELNAETDRILNFIDKVLYEIRDKSKATILLHNFEIPVYPVFGVLDNQDPHKQVNTIRKLNDSLLEVIVKYESIYIIDVDLIQSICGYRNYFDNRYWNIGRAPYTNIASKLIANEYAKFVRAIKGKNKKCLVLDCDNTLWGGVVGEEGLSKIQIGSSHPGSAFQEFQKAILNLYRRGVMLALCSKNNKEDVFEVLEKHPDMILRKDHFITMRINWKDKVANIREIADELNIGLDSLVFMDDSEFEINLIRKMLPEITAIRLPEDPVEYKNVLTSCGLFDTLTFSEEDRKRNEMYKAEIRRKKTKTQFQASSLEDYYKYLEMEVVIKSGDEFSIPRISQLTQKTNQFNLTTIRYSESQVNEFCKSDDYNVRFLNLKDRFGDTGIVGVAILKYETKKCYIDTFLLSCRVIGRGVEEVFLADCLNIPHKKGCDEIIGIYSPTKKNIQVKDFYKNHNFTFVENKNSTTMSRFSLNKELLKFPEYFRSIQIDD